MRKSEYSDQDKLKIITDIESSILSIHKSCAKNGISIGTYYQWKKLLHIRTINSPEQENIDDITLAEENSTLRKLYINLSAHNYELAKFLNNQL